jgi:hypothetical protein
VFSQVGVRLVGCASRSAARLLALLLAASALALTPTGARGAGAQAIGHRHAATAPRGAMKVARSLLRRIVLPAGARAGGSSSDGTPELHGPDSQPPAPNLLDAHAYWHLPGDPDVSAGWLHGHPPALATVKGGGPGAGGTANIWWVRFTFHARRERFASEELVVAMVRANDGGTLLRADAQITWVARR